MLATLVVPYLLLHSEDSACAAKIDRGHHKLSDTLLPFRRPKHCPWWQSSRLKMQPE